MLGLLRQFSQQPTARHRNGESDQRWYMHVFIDLAVQYKLGLPPAIWLLPTCICVSLFDETCVCSFDGVDELSNCWRRRRSRRAFILLAKRTGSLALCSFHCSLRFSILALFLLRGFCLLAFFVFAVLVLCSLRGLCSFRESRMFSLFASFRNYEIALEQRQYLQVFIGLVVQCKLGLPHRQSALTSLYLWQLARRNVCSLIGCDLRMRTLL